MPKPSFRRFGWSLRGALTLGLAPAGLVFVPVFVPAAGCADAEAAPVEAAKGFANAVYFRDVDTVLTLLESTTRERVKQSAEVASDQVGGRRQVSKREMFQIVGWDRRFKAASAELVEGGETTARVRMVDPAGEIAFVDLVLEDDAWRVRIPTPESQAADASEAG